ncbi:dinitrogenase iron-molybdenum cofactor biosynthesis protein [Sporanaerobium hydrogeniformans]|uniref:Dinitrogenase iron-molybdenum cofactor biosynthesis protein n=1 Tax=Sporanaerobium hydrogeniformans TaxID=3072179 RepID=A0AC61DD84_9FIRM|nr:NifB/NifX family molybdenum-iron cluster-binding protein [Sporanaerobium hydrogeniformans]PHV70532.1 dinitrogenase iron-molybdenum cofactor biosynthesis protein [Sporanaerobium hydrogeniformans]
MAYRVAFASSDGIVVNQHFGRTPQFQVYEIKSAEQVTFIEERSNTPSCQEFEHSIEALEKTIGIISDCKFVFVSRIGPGAYDELRRHGIEAYEMSREVQEILENLKRTNRK